MSMDKVLLNTKLTKVNESISIYRYDNGYMVEVFNMAYFWGNNLFLLFNKAQQT